MKTVILLAAILTMNLFAQPKSFYELLEVQKHFGTPDERCLIAHITTDGPGMVQYANGSTSTVQGDNSGSVYLNLISGGGVITMTSDRANGGKATYYRLSNIKVYELEGGEIIIGADAELIIKQGQELGTLISEKYEFYLNITKKTIEFKSLISNKTHVSRFNTYSDGSNNLSETTSQMVCKLIEAAGYKDLMWSK